MSDLEPSLSASSEMIENPAQPNAVGRSISVPQPETTSRLLEGLKWVFSFPAMLGTILVGAVFYDCRGFFVDPDVWWHIRVGQDILRSHHWPTTDSFSFTAANSPWIAYEWLGDVILGSLAKLGGNAALAALLTTLVAAVVLALYFLGTLRSGNSKASFVAVMTVSFLVLAIVQLAAADVWVSVSGAAVDCAGSFS